MAKIEDAVHDLVSTPNLDTLNADDWSARQRAVMARYGLSDADLTEVHAGFNRYFDQKVIELVKASEKPFLVKAGATARYFIGTLVVRIKNRL